jgi:hypothetical protein
MLMFLLVAGCSDGGDDNNAEDATVDYWVTVSGTITTAGGVPVSGVMISTMYQLELLNVNLWEGSISSNLFSWIMTDENGYYSITLPAGLIENYTLVITPSKKSYTFTPANRVLTIAGVDQTGVNFTAALASGFSQADLTGTWRINMLRTGTENQWMRARITVGATGVATCNSMYYSNAPATNVCPATGFDLRFTMDSEGVITQSGAQAVGDGGHMTMNSGKNFMAGTGTNGTSYQLMIAQKEDVAVTAATATPTTTHYNVADVQGNNFVFHSLSVGGTNQWRYGAGATSSTAVITMSSEADSAGGTATTLDGWTLSLAADGYVTRTDIAGLLSDFQGFLSADEKTIVGTYSENGTDYKLIVIQFIDGQTMDEMTGSSINHLLAAADGLTPVWAYHDINISKFETSFLPDILELTFALNVMLSYNWELSTAYTVVQRLGLVDLERINFGATGAATILDTSTDPDTTVFHGQLAFDGTFMIGVETLTLPDGGVVYALDAITH